MQVTGLAGVMVKVVATAMTYELHPEASVLYGTHTEYMYVFHALHLDI